MSDSGSVSGSFSSSEAIIAHFDEAAGTLEEGGFKIPDHYWHVVTSALQTETIDEISFWGVSPSGDGKALLQLRIDWRTHTLTVSRGDSVPLPVVDGGIKLLQVRRAAQGFLRAFVDRRLTAELRIRYTPEANRRRMELNKQYGAREADDVRRSGGKGWEVDSRAYKAVRLAIWFGD